MVLVGTNMAQLHALGPPWPTASPVAGGCAAAGWASDRSPATIHGSFHSSTLIRHTAT